MFGGRHTGTLILAKLGAFVLARPLQVVIVRWLLC